MLSGWEEATRGQAKDPEPETAQEEATAAK
jgi:hypothetical protein